MDALTFISYVLAVVETGALLCTLVFITRAMKEPKGSEARKKAFRNAAIFAIIYFALNSLRRFNGIVS